MKGKRKNMKIGEEERETGAKDEKNSKANYKGKGPGKMIRENKKTPKKVMEF